MSMYDYLGKAEVALMGHVIEVSDDTELRNIINYIAQVVNDNEECPAEEILTEAFQYTNTKKYRVSHISVNTLLGDMVVLTLILSTTTRKTPVKLDSFSGVFSYCYNFTAPFCSELGYTFYEKRPNGTYHRIG